MSTGWRVALAFVFAPIIPCAISVVPNKLLQPEWTGYWLVIGYELLVCYLLILGLALPLYFYLRDKGQVSLTSSLVAGAAIGAVASVALIFILAFPPPPGGSASDSGGTLYVNGQTTTHGYFVLAQDVLTSAVFGTSIAFIFWILGVRNSGQIAGRVDL